MSDFATTLKRIRTEKGMSQEEFATFLGTSKQNISRYENGEVSPKISTAAKMAAKLGITIAQLNGDESAGSGSDSMGEPQPDPEVQLRLKRLAVILSDVPTESQKQILDFAEFVLKNQAPSPGSED